MRKAGIDIAGLNDFLNSGKTQRKLSKRDVIYRQGDRAVVRLWNTDIATYSPMERRLKLNSGGWQTNTTKDRLNKLLYGRDAYIQQSKFKWRLVDNRRKVSYPFKDDMEIDY